MAVAAEDGEVGAEVEGVADGGARERVVGGAALPGAAVVSIARKITAIQRDTVKVTVRVFGQRTSWTPPVCRTCRQVGQHSEDTVGIDLEHHPEGGPAAVCHSIEIPS